MKRTIKGYAIFPVLEANCREVLVWCGKPKGPESFYVPVTLTYDDGKRRKPARKGK